MTNNHTATYGKICQHHRSCSTQAEVVQSNKNDFLLENKMMNTDTFPNCNDRNHRPLHQNGSRGKPYQCRRGGYRRHSHSNGNATISTPWGGASFPASPCSQNASDNFVRTLGIAGIIGVIGGAAALIIHAARD